MNKTLKLLKIIGSPFAPDEVNYEPSVDEAIELYHYAVKNKIGLLYLESLNNLEDYGLKKEYEENKNKHKEQVKTAIRISEVLNISKVDYAVIKSIMPFIATPNDVDIIHFGSDEEYENAVKQMLHSEYEEIKCKAVAQRMFHDVKHGGFIENHSPEKDVYDIDIYQELAAGHVLYLDKRKLYKYSSDMDFEGNRIKVLTPEAELVTIITHSVVEMIFTLFVYYATLHYVLRINKNGLKKLIEIAKENNVIFALNVHFSVVSELHEKAHGFVPEKVQYVLKELDYNEKILSADNLDMPHIYGASILIKTLLGRIYEKKFIKSVFRQLISMLNPIYLRYVIWNVMWRRNRETY